MAWLAKSMSGWGHTPKSTVTPVHSAMARPLSAGTGTRSGAASSSLGLSSVVVGAATSPASRICSLIVVTVPAAEAGVAQASPPSVARRSARRRRDGAATGHAVPGAQLGRAARPALGLAQAAAGVHEDGHPQVEVGRHDRRDHGDDAERHLARRDGGEDHLQLGPQAGREGRARLGQQQDGEGQRQHGLAAGQAPVARQVVVGVALAPEHGHDGEAADGHEHVGEEVVERGAGAAGRAGGHPEEDEPGVVDRRVGQHPLHVALAQGHEGAEHQREHRQPVDDRAASRSR